MTSDEWQMMELHEAAEIEAINAKIDAAESKAAMRCAYAECRRREMALDAERAKVAELRAALDLVRESFRGTHYMESGMEARIDAILAKTGGGA